MIFIIKIIIFCVIFNISLFCEKNISLSFVGDIMMGTDFPSRDYLPPSSGKYLFSKVSNYFTNDIVFGNLEATLCNSGYTRKPRTKNSYSFRTPEKYVINLKNAGFDCVNIANNHSRDFGLNCLEITTKLLLSNNIQPVGIKNKPATLIRNDKKIYIAGFHASYGFNNINQISNSMIYLKKIKNDCDILIVSFHGGAEGEQMYMVPKKMERYYSEYRGDVYKFAHQAIDNGADIVIGHGPHVLRGIEIYKNRLIAYSLGNFLVYKRFVTQGRRGITLILQAAINNSGELISAGINAINISKEGIPYPDLENKAISIINKLNKENFPENLYQFDTSTGQLQFK